MAYFGPYIHIYGDSTFEGRPLYVVCAGFALNDEDLCITKTNVVCVFVYL
jgi:hypothetical protein